PTSLLNININIFNYDKCFNYLINCLFFFSYIISYGQRAMDKLLSNYRLTLKHHNVRHHYIREAVASGWKQHIMYNMFSEKLYTWDIVGGHAEIIHTERIIVWNLEEKIHILELNIEKPQEWYTLTKEEKIKVLDIEALDNLQRELICGPHFLHYITEIPDQELLHKAHFLILQSAEDVSNFVIGFKSGVKTRREAYKDDPFILAKYGMGLDLIK
ncbi:hypothetical protein ACJX0J_015048, partial [Zea mays]